MLLRWKLERELRNDCSNIGEVHFGPMENGHILGGGWRYEQSNDGKLIRYREGRGGLDNVPQQVVVPTLSHCVSISHCHRWSAYLVARAEECFQLYVRDIGRDHSTAICVGTNVKAVEWAADGALFYSVSSSGDDLVRASQVWRRDAEGVSRLVREEPDPQWMINLSACKDRSHILVAHLCYSATEYWAVPSADSSRPPQLVGPPREKKRRYAVDFLSRQQTWVWWMIDSQTLLLSSALQGNGGREIFKAPAGAAITDLEVLRDDICLFGYENTIPTLISVQKGGTSYFPLYTCITPSVQLEVSQEMPSYTLSRPSDTTPLERLIEDECGVPITLFPGKDANSPTLLHVYGAYGSVSPPTRENFLLPLIRRGWGIAYAHVRGGGMLGPSWHAQGRGENRAVASADVVRVASFLKSRRHLVGPLLLRAFSAGGFTAAAALHAKPRLFQGALLEVPFLNPLAEINNNASAVGKLEMDEWGTPQSLRLLDPCETLPHTDARLPPMYITASPTDSRVPIKMITRYHDIAMKLASPPQIQLSIVESHFHTTLKERAHQLAFLLNTSKNCYSSKK